MKPIAKDKTSETITENIFRDYYRKNGKFLFIEKSAIPDSCGFMSKRGTSKSGYPDFFKEEPDYVILVEAKSESHQEAESDTKFYMHYNKINKDIIGIAVSGQSFRKLRVTYFVKTSNKIEKLQIKDTLIDLFDLNKTYRKHKYGERISIEELQNLLKELNAKFNDNNKIRDTDRSLFFSGIMIALCDNNFRNIYHTIQPPMVGASKAKVIESTKLNQEILEAINNQLSTKINNHSKEINWRDRFSFIKTIDYPLVEYKQIIKIIEEKIYIPFTNSEKHDILGKAYQIFLRRAGHVEDKNIILTPDHIKSLMIKLANLNVDDVVIDTCTGTGGFLMNAMENLFYLANGNPDKINAIKEKQLIGFEIDAVLFSLACSNMFLHGDGRTNLLYRSSLLNDKTENITNGSDAELFEHIKSFKPTKCIINPPYENNNAIKFTKQAIDYLEPNGKLVIIMPSNTLTKNQNGRNNLVAELLESATLDFVIKRPSTLFTEQKRTVNPSIFGFTKAPHPQNKEVQFFYLENDGLVSVQHKGRIDKYKKWNGIEALIIDTILNSKEIEGISEKKKIFYGSKLNSAGIMSEENSHNMLKIEDLFYVEKGSLASEDNDEGEYDFITAGKEWKKHSEYSHDTEAIVFAVEASGSLGRTHYVNGKFIASNLCLILTPKQRDKYPVLLEYYNKYFDSIRRKLVWDIAEGGSKLHIVQKELKNYYIDYISLDEQKLKLKQIIENEINQKEKELNVLRQKMKFF